VLQDGVDLALRLHLDHIAAGEQAIAAIEAEVGSNLDRCRDAVNLLSGIPGVSAIVAQGIGSEIGLDMSRFPTAGHLISWAGLCPRNDGSAGKRRSTRLRKSTLTLAEGAMLNLTVFATSGAPLIGQTFERVQIVRGLTGALVVLGTLLQGYITAAQDLGWPGSPIVNSLDGQPVPRILSGTDPAAGVDINETVPTGARWQLHSFRGELATDATVGARRPRLQILDTGTFFLTLAAPATQPASENRNYYWATGLGHESTVDTQVITSSMPDSLILPAGSQIRTNTSLLAGGDNWGAPLLLVREWIEGS
jgi:hypothetical protein